jgi:hypothetical protein
MSGGESSLSSELAARVAAELAPDEKLLWVGQPRPGLVMRPAYFLVPFGGVFAAFALIWVVVAMIVTNGLMAPCGLPFLAVGVWLMFSPVWLGRQARRTLYALTDRRAIIWEPGWFGAFTVRNYTAAGLGRMSRTERADGSGDLVFEEITTVTTSGNTGTRYNTVRRGFLGIDNVREVEDQVRRTLLPGG